MMSGIEAFEAYLKNERRYSVHTYTAYVTDVSQFFIYTRDQYQAIAPEEVSTPMVKSWIYHNIQLDLNPRSVNRKLTAVNSFYKFLLRTGMIQKNPLSAISGIKTSKRLYQWVEEKDMDKLFDFKQFGMDFPGRRDKLILELLYGTGIRRAELIGLTVQNADLKNQVIKVLGKRNKERIIPIPLSLGNAIEEYMALRNQQGINCSQLLVTDSGDPLYPMFVQRCVKKHISLVSNVSKTSPHVLRHTYATHLLNKGADINAIKELLGHASLAATQVYTHNSIERLKTIYKQSHPKS